MIRRARVCDDGVLTFDSRALSSLYEATGTVDDLSSLSELMTTMKKQRVVATSWGLLLPLFRNFIHVDAWTRESHRFHFINTRRVASSLSNNHHVLEDLLPEDLARRDDVKIALQAVRKACAVTQRLQPVNVNVDSVGTLTKQDSSPVTVADFAAQAVVLQHLAEAFPKDSFIAEESSETLDPELAKIVMEASSILDRQELNQCIDLGKEYTQWESDPAGRPRRVWCLDPIDGTKGFLRGKRQGGQYCVALALLEDGVPVIGILGCPNLPTSVDDSNYEWTERENDDNNVETRGCIFAASKGSGCYQLSLAPGKSGKRIQGASGTVDPSEARFCVGVEEGFADPLGKCKDMARLLHGPEGIDKDTGDIMKARRIDSQAKYGVLARGGSELYVRLPKRGYQEWIWDVAPGIVVLEEAGGRVTDTDGNPIDCSLGSKLPMSVRGVLGASDKQIHVALVDAYQRQEERRKNK
jgi:3'(2'), 5'-bisphosphate nucleotidase